jgi:hypothetical protein
MLIIKCRKSNVSIIENHVSDVTIWFNNRFERINRRVIEIWSVINLMFAFFDDSRQKFIMIFNSFDLFECSNIISIESNDLQHDADFDAIKFEVMIDSNIVNVAKDSQIVSDFESKLIKLNSDSIFEFVLRSRPQYEYVTSSHLIVALNQASLLDNLSNSSVNRILRFIDHAQTLSERTEKWARNLRRKFYWTIHEEIHFMIFTSESEDDIKTTRKRIEIDIEAFYLVNPKIQINLDAS